VETSFTRFLVVVLSAYKQIRSQKDNFLSDISEDNFDRAFKFLRPVIQGGSDVGRRISEDELHQTLDFCAKLFTPTTTEEHRTTKEFLAERLKGKATDSSDPEATNLRFLDTSAPVIDPRIIQAIAKERLASDTGNTAPDSQSSASDSMTDSGREETIVEKVLHKVNALRVIHGCKNKGMHNFESESLGQSSTGGGWVARLEKGRLGLVHTDALV